MPTTSNTSTTEYTDIYAPDSVDAYSDIYAPPEDAVLGSGTESTDTYLSTLFGILDADIEENILTQTSKNQEFVSKVPQNDLKQVLRDKANFYASQSLNHLINKGADRFAETGDSKIVEETEQAVDDHRTATTPEEQLLAATLYKLNSAPNAAAKEHILHTYRLQRVEQFIEENAGSAWADFLGSLWPGRGSIQNIKNGLGLVDGIRKAANNYRNLEYADQAKEFDQTLRWLWDVSKGNSHMFGTKLAPFLNLDDIESVYNALMWDIVDVGSLLPIQRVMRLGKALRTPAHIAAGAGNTRAAGKIAAKVAGDATGKAAKAAGMGRIEGAASTLPFGGQAAIPEIVDGINVEAQQIITKLLTEFRDSVSNIIYRGGNEFIERSALSASERAAAESKYLEQFGANARVVERNPNGFTVEVDIVNPKYKDVDTAAMKAAIDEGEAKIVDLRLTLQGIRDELGEAAYTDPRYLKLLDEFADLRAKNRRATKIIDEHTSTPKTILDSRKIVFTKNDIGTFDAVEYSKANRVLSAPRTFIDQLEQGLVDEATVIGFTQQQMRDRFEAIMGKSLAGVSKKERSQLGSILMQGDTDKIARYSANDLINGVMTRDGFIRLTSAEQIARYHAIRDMYDTVYLLKNRQVRRQLVFAGYDRSVVLGDKGFVGFVKSEKGLKTVPEDVSELFDFHSGRVITVGSKSIINRRIEEQGWGLLKLKVPYEYSPGRKVQYVLAKPEHLKKLPSKVLNYRDGYVPRIWKNIFHVAVEHGGETLNGVTRAGATVRRFFDNKTEADIWKNLPDNVGKNIEVLPGKEYLKINPAFKEEYEANIFGGLYTGERAETVVPFGLKGTRPEHIGGLQALEAAMHHTATQLPMNEFRMGLTQRFLNSARNPVTGKSYLANPGDWQSKITAPPTSKEYSGLVAMQTWMSDIFRLPTKDERIWNNIMFRVGSFLDNEKAISITPVNTARKWLMNLGDKDLAAASRAVAFHGLLGWFNPRQLYVQGLSAAVAWAIDPINAPKLTSRYMALRAVMYSDNPELWSQARKAMAGATSFMSDTEFKQLVAAYRKSGISDSIRSTADYDAAIRGHGFSRNALANAADKGLLFFREGELYTRSYAWLLAYDRLITSKGAGHVITDLEIDQVTKESLRYTMNMNRANRAAWQRGILSIPLQFQQVSTKFIENMMYSKKSGRGIWTPAEKFRIMTGQILMFGAAGIPAGKVISQNIATWLKDDGDYGPAVTDPKVIAAIQGGFTEYALYGALGSPVTVSKSLSYAGNLQQLFENLTRVDRTSAKLMFGAAGEMGSRAYKAVLHIAPVLAAPVDEDIDWDGVDVATVLSEVAGVVSTWRNIDKARLWARLGIITTDKGVGISALDPENDYPLLFAQAIGIPPADLEDYYTQSAFAKVTEEGLSKVVDARMAIAKRYINNKEYESEANLKKVLKQIEIVEWGLTDAQKLKVQERMAQKFADNDLALTKQVAEALGLQEDLEGNTPDLEFNYNLVPEERE